MAFGATVLGASGYGGAELVRLLAQHPALQPLALAAGSWAGAEAGSALPHLTAAGLPGLGSLDEVAGTGADVCFSCLPGGKLAEIAEAVQADVIVDLSDDFRDSPEWTYGLTEFARKEVAGSKRIANPGCYPTAVLLALVPFARRDLVRGPVVVDAMSGVSGAGRKVEDDLMFGTVDGNVRAYGTVEHRHIPEMERGLNTFGGGDMTISFTPHLVPLARGLVATVRARLARPLTDDECLDVLKETYDGEPFVHAAAQWPSTKPVTGSNGAAVSARVDRRNGFLVASGAIDNLGKGAAGQALQNANLALGLDEGSGLARFGIWP